MEQDEEVNLEETKKEMQRAGNWLKDKLKDPKFWIDNATLIVLIILVIYLWFQGKFIETNIIETCNGIPIK